MSEELKELKARIDEWGAQRELVGAYAAQSTEAWHNAEAHAEHLAGEIGTLLDRLAPDYQEKAQKIKEAWPSVQAAFASLKEPETLSETFHRLAQDGSPDQSEEPSVPARRGEVVTDLSTLRKGDIVDCYWRKFKEEGLTLEEDASSNGFGGTCYWWDPSRFPGQEVRLVEKAKPERLTDSSLLPTAKGSRIRVYRIEFDEIGVKHSKEGVELESDGDLSGHSWWTLDRRYSEELTESLLDSSEIKEFEILHDAAKENA